MIDYILKRRFFYSIILTLLSFTVILISQIGRKRMDFPIFGSVKDVFNPVKNVGQWSSQSILGIWDSYIYLVDVREENLILKDKVSELESKVNELSEYEFLYNDALKNLGYVQKTKPEYIFTNVTYITPSSYSELFSVDRGLKDGINVNDGVIVPGGIIGRVISVADNSATVQLITDARSQYPVILKNSRTRVMLSGMTNGELRVFLIPIETELKLGEEVITGGFSGVFPKGLRVGKISKIYPHQQGLFKEALVEPYPDFRKLESVIVVKQGEVNLKANTPSPDLIGVDSK